MLIATVILLAVPQMPYSPSTEGDACARANVVQTTPAGTLQLLDDFRASLSTVDRQRLDRALPRDADGGIAQCDAGEGSRASCEAAAYMSALRRTGLMPHFLATICPNSLNAAGRPAPAGVDFVGARHPHVPAARIDHLPDRGRVLAHPVMPSDFRGHWSADLKACDLPPIDESQLWVTPTSFDLYETNGRIVRVVAENPRRIVITLRSEGEGITFVARKGLVMSADGQTLTVRNEDDTGRKMFVRCPVEQSAPTFIPHHTMRSD